MGRRMKRIWQMVCTQQKNNQRKLRACMGKTEGWVERLLTERTGITRRSPFSRAQAELTRERAASEVRVTCPHAAEGRAGSKNRALERSQSWGPMCESQRSEKR